MAYYINYDMLTHESWEMHMTCNFNCLIETEGLSKVTCTDVSY